MPLTAQSNAWTGHQQEDIHQRSLVCSSSHGMLFHLDLAEERERDMVSEVCSVRLQAVQERLSFLSGGGGSFVQQLQCDVRRLMRCLSAEGPVDVVVMASRLALVGYSVTVRTAIGGGPSCFRNLRHVFLTIQGEGEYKETQFIVDPSFKEQFLIPQPSATYSAVLSLVPQEFVGSSSRLIPLVQCLCAEMSASFDCQGLTLPPWRRAQSMLSKWLPSRSRDISFGSSSSTCSSNVAAGSSCSESEGGSPLDTVAGCSPFSRITDLQVADRVTRQNSSKSLLSGKLAVCTTTTSNSSSSSSSNALGRTFSSGRSFANAHSKMAAAAAAGVVCMQPSPYRGEPPTYKVKIAAASALQWRR